LLVTVNSRLKFEIKIVHDLSCHAIFNCKQRPEQWLFDATVPIG